MIPVKNKQFSQTVLKYTIVKEKQNEHEGMDIIIGFQWFMQLIGCKPYSKIIVYFDHCVGQRFGVPYISVHFNTSKGQTDVWNAVCNKNPFLFPHQITLLSDFISLFPREIRNPYYRTL